MPLVFFTTKFCIFYMRNREGDFLVRLWLATHSNGVDNSVLGSYPQSIRLEWTWYLISSTRTEASSISKLSIVATLLINGTKAHYREKPCSFVVGTFIRVIDFWIAYLLRAARKSSWRHPYQRQAKVPLFVSSAASYFGSNANVRPRCFLHGASWWAICVIPVLCLQVALLLNEGAKKVRRWRWFRRSRWFQGSIIMSCRDTLFLSAWVSVERVSRPAEPSVRSARALTSFSF